MPRYKRKDSSNTGKRWIRTTLVCSTLLPLLISPLNALRLPSSSGTSRIRERYNTRYAIQVEEVVVHFEPKHDTASDEPEEPLHYAFEPVASVNIVGADKLHNETIMPRLNGYSGDSNGFPYHVVTFHVNGEKVNGESVNDLARPERVSPVVVNGKRVVNGVKLPPYNMKPPQTNGFALNGTSQPLQLNGDSKSSLNVQSADESDTPDDIEEEEKSQPTLRKLWQRRHARSIEEGVRNEKTREQTTQLSRILSKAPLGPPKRGYFARTISGLITALADEADGLKVEVKTQEETPLWRKKVDAIEINFSRLGFKPLRMGGLDEAIRSLEMEIPESQVDQLAEDLELAAVSSADEAFDRIDADNSGALDSGEIAKALNMAASSDSDQGLFEELASELVELYDFNGDGVVDRGEYQNLVADMAALREAERNSLNSQSSNEAKSGIWGVFGKVSRWLRRKGLSGEADVFEMEQDDEKDEEAVVEDNFVDISDDVQVPMDVDDLKAEKLSSSEEVVNISNDAAVNSVGKRGGSIILEDLKLDLRQLVFGVVPIIKRITPGGPLILEPFTATITGSFNTKDIRASILLDMGLRRLVARALRRRVRSFRDLMDGAVFYGRRWNLTSKSAPMVEVPELTSVEFDDQNRMILTGRAQVRTSPDAPFIENSFKVRTRIGTRNDGQCIRLVEPELAFVLECPKSWEKTIRLFVASMGLPMPARPKPLYSFFPIYSPFQVDDNDGFDMGEDNRIKSIEIKDGALQFELSAVLRPGRFLGNHYLAFTLPMRTFIITMARVREGIRTARRNKRAAQAQARLLKNAEHKDKARSYLDVVAQSLSNQELVADREKFRFADTRHDKKVVVVPQAQGNKSFFSRFVDGYLGSGSDDKDEHHRRLTSAISDWFGRQGTTIADDDDASSTTESGMLKRRRQTV